MNAIARLLGRGVEKNPDVVPQSAANKSVVRFWVAYLVGMLLEWGIRKLTGMPEQVWVPWALAALRGVLDLLRTTYKADPTAGAPPPAS